MSTFKIASAVAEFPAASTAVPAGSVVLPTAPGAPKATAHRDRVSGTGMTNVVFGQTCRPQEIPL